MYFSLNSCLFAFVIDPTTLTTINPTRLSPTIWGPALRYKGNRGQLLKIEFLHCDLNMMHETSLRGNAYLELKSCNCLSATSQE